MKNRIFISTVILIGSFFVGHRPIASSKPTDSALSASGVKIEIFEDEKMISDKILADYFFIPDQKGQWHGYWRHIYIDPHDESKRVILKIESWSTVANEITNFQSFGDGCSFDLTVGELLGKRKMQIVIKKQNFSHKVVGSALWYSDILNRAIKTEWKSTDKRYFELPYNRVF